MSYLFHAFARGESTAGPGRFDQKQLETSFAILRLILLRGLLCTPERFKIYADPATERACKLALLRRHLPHDILVQSRACFTLMDGMHELSQQYHVSPDDPLKLLSHADIFGPFAIGLDALEARSLGILPTVYTYQSPSEVDLTRAECGVVPLASQIIHRLDEIRTLLKILSQIEAKSELFQSDILSVKDLRELGVKLQHELAIKTELAKLRKHQAKEIVHLLNSDRVAAWSLLDFVNMMLSLYQFADSTYEQAPLAFFRQKEWRLVHHMRRGLSWFSLGEHSRLTDPDPEDYSDDREAIREYVKRTRSFREATDSAEFLSKCWVLHQCDSKPFRAFIRLIVVPSVDFKSRTEEILGSLDSMPQPPTVVVRAPPWRIHLKKGVPTVQILDEKPEQ